MAIIKRLLYSGKDGDAFTAEDVRKLAFKGTELSDEEARAAADIANFLNPFIPKKDALEDISVFNAIQIATITNTVVSLVQPQQKEWKLSPKSSQSRGLPLSAASLYQLLRKGYEIPSGDTGEFITNVNQARKSKEELFQAFFDVDKMKQFLKRRGLEPYWRLVYVDRWRVRVVGKKVVTRMVEIKLQKPSASKKQHHGRRKKKKRKSSGSGVSKRKAEDDHDRKKRHKTEHDDDKLKVLEKELKEVRSELSKERKEQTKLERIRADKGRQFRQGKKSGNWDGLLYAELQNARKEVNSHYLKMDSLKERSSQLSQQLYEMQRGVYLKDTKRETKQDEPRRVCIIIFVVLFITRTDIRFIEGNKCDSRSCKRRKEIGIDWD